MRRFLCITLFLCIIFPASAGALDFDETYYLGGGSDGGASTATIQITIDNATNTLTAIVNNISSTSLNDGTPNANAPGITGFGFNIDDPEPSLTSWTLFADDVNSNPVQIGGSSGGTGEWTMGTSLAGVSLDYLPNNGGNADGALFNPAAKTASTLPGGSNTNYFTTATLTMIFDDDPIFDFQEGLSPFARFQNVGLGGKGSTKVYVPEPSTMIISGLFLLGAGIFVRRKLHRKS
jgi:hypothetical protein